jgi:hypothetical protein
MLPLHIHLQSCKFTRQKVSLKKGRLKIICKANKKADFKILNNQSYFKEGRFLIFFPNNT